MTTLSPCRSCGKPAGRDARTCPHCGERWPDPRPSGQGFLRGFLALAVLVGIIVVLAILLGG